VKTRHFLNKLEHERIEAAIRQAETGTSGDIVVFITHKAAPDALAAAHQVFTKRHLEKAVDDNSLLLFLAPTSQTFAVVGGKALYHAVGQGWWDELAVTLSTHFRTAHYTEGIVLAVNRAGDALKQHFPAEKIDRTGQSDIVEE
jgi:uncharacterized membrane protein